MITKELISRIVHKSDVEKRWQLAVDFVPLKGEIIIYDRDDNIEDESLKGTYSYARFKIGDGVTKVNDLPFANSSNFIGPDAPGEAPDGSFWVDTDEEGGFKITVNGIAPNENGNIEIEVTDPYELPVGGDELGGVKNGGNVVIDATGAMNVEVPSIDGLASESYVDDAIGAIEIPSIEGLATEEYVDGAIAAIPKVEVNYPVVSVNGQTGAVNLDAEAVGALSKDTAIPTVPTNVSAFANDAGYLTQHQSLAGLATEGYVDGVAEGLQDNIDTLSSAVELLTNGVDTETVDGVNDLIAYVNEHGTEVTGMKADIQANADALAELAPVAKTGSWNDLEDKPFGEIGSGVVIEWDGNTEGLESSGSFADFDSYHVSNLTPSIDEMIGGSLAFSDGQLLEVTEDWVVTVADGVVIVGEFSVFVVYKENATFTHGDTTFSFPKTGMYFLRSRPDISVFYTSSFTYGGGSSVKTLDEKYIPSSIARVSDIPVVDLTLYETKVNAESKLAEAKSYTDEAVGAITFPEVNYPVTSVNGQTGAVVIDIPSTEGLATETYVDNAISGITRYYTKEEIDNMEFITLDEIDAICSRTIQMVSPTSGTF